MAPALELTFGTSKVGTYRVELVVLDTASGAFGITSATLVVNKARGTISVGLTGPARGNVGFAANFTALLDDLNVPPGFTAVWRVLDAAGDFVTGGTGHQFSFAPATAETFSVQLTLTENATNISTLVIAAFAVSADAPTLPVSIAGPTQGVRGPVLTFGGLLNGTDFPSNVTAAWKVFDQKNAVVATGSGSQFVFLPTIPGQYRVELLLVDPTTGLFGVASSPLSIVPPTPSFSVGLSGPTAGVRGQAVILTAQHDGGTLPAGYRSAWQVVDAASRVIATGNGATFVFAPAASGALTVRLTLIDITNGAEGTAISTLNISEPAPGLSVGVSGPTLGILDELLAFGGLLNGAAFTGNYAVSWSAALFDPADHSETTVATGVGRDFVFAPSAEGTYLVHYRIVDGTTGAIGNATLTLNIPHDPPASEAPRTIGLIGLGHATVGETLTFNGLIEAGTLAPDDSFAWRVLDSSDAVVGSGTTADFVFVPAVAGDFRVEFTLSDKNANVTGSANSTLRVGAALPSLTSGISGPIEATRGQVRTFTALTGMGGIPAGLTGTWSALDGSNVEVATSTGATFAFAPPSAGHYTIRFTLLDPASGATSVTEMHLLVTAPVPTLDVRFLGPTAGALAQPLNFAALLDGLSIPAGFVGKWSVIDSGNVVIASSSAADFTFTPAAAGQFRVRFDLADPATGAIGEAIAPLNVSSTQATLNVSINGPSTGLHGQPLTFDGLLGGVAVPSLRSFWNVTDSHNVVVAQGSGAQFAFAPANAGRFNVRYTFVDPVTGAFGTADAALDVTALTTIPAAASGLGISGPNAGVRAQPLTFHGFLDGAAIVGNYETNWRVLDAVGNVVALGTGREFAFTPTRAGHFGVEFTLANRDSGAVEKVTTPLRITTYLQHADPAIPGRFILLVGGSEGADVITFTKTRKALDSITLTLLEKQFGSGKLAQDFAGVSRIEVFGGFGDDSITIDSKLDPIPALLDGGAGKDTLAGGKGANTLLGGFGDDKLTGGISADVIDGGKGADTVKAGLGDDFVIFTEGGDRITGDAGNDTFLVAAVGLGTNAMIDGGMGDDIFNINSAAAGTTVSLKTGAGLNLLNVGSSAGVLPATGGTVDQLNGLVRVEGNKFDILVIDESANSQVRTLTLSATLLSGLGDGSGALEYRAIGTQNVRLGSGNDIVHIEGSGAATKTIFLTGEGANTVIAGNALGLLSAIKGAVVIAGSGSDIFNVQASQSVSSSVGRLNSTNILGAGMGAQGIAFAGLARLNLNFGKGRDILTIDSTPSVPVSVSTGDGNDVINIHATTAALSIDTGDGADVVNLGSKTPATKGVLDLIVDPVTITGGANTKGVDVMNVDHTGSATGATGMLTLTALTGLGLGGGISYAGFESVKIGLGTGDDTLTLTGGSDLYTKVNAGLGTNTVTIVA